MRTPLTAITKPFRLERHLTTMVALRWLATRWQCQPCFSLEILEDLHSELLLFLELGGDEIPEPLGLAEVFEELAEVGQIVTDLPTLAAHAELHHLKWF